MIQVLDLQESIIQIQSVRYKSGKLVSIWGNLGQILRSEIPQVFIQKGQRRDSVSAWAKKKLDIFKIDTKQNSQESIPGKVRFQKKWSGKHGPPVRPPPFFPRPRRGGLYIKGETFQSWDFLTRIPKFWQASRFCNVQMIIV